MNSKNLIIDFINFLFLLGLVILSIVYFVVWDKFSSFQAFLKFLLPVIGLGGMFVAVRHIKKKRKEKREKEGNMEVILRLSYGDKMKSDLVVFGVPFLILIIPFFFKGNISFGNLIQIATSFIILYVWHKYLFNQEE